MPPELRCPTELFGVPFWPASGRIDIRINIWVCPVISPSIPPPARDGAIGGDCNQWSLVVPTKVIVTRVRRHRNFTRWRCRQTLKARSGPYVAGFSYYNDIDHFAFPFLNSTPVGDAGQWEAAGRPSRKHAVAALLPAGPELDIPFSALARMPRLAPLSSMEKIFYSREMEKFSDKTHRDHHRLLSLAVAVRHIAKTSLPGWNMKTGRLCDQSLMIFSFSTY